MSKKEWSSISISGKIDNPDIESIIYIPYLSYAQDESAVRSCQVDEKGNFQFTVSSQLPGTAMFIAGDARFLIILNSENDLELNVTADQEIAIVREKGEDNQIFLEYQKRFSPFFESSLDYRLEPLQFALQVDSISDLKTSFLNKFDKKISKNLNEYLKHDIEYYSASEKIYYARRYANKLIKEENLFFEFLDEIQIQNEEAIVCLNYMNFINNYINYLYLSKLWSIGVDHKNDFVEKYYLAKETLTGETLEQFQTENLRIGMIFKMENEADLFQDLVDDFLIDDNSERSKNIIRAQQELDKQSKMKVGLKAPEFSLKGTDNLDYKLSDFEGKLVVIDFWASWCGPCRKAIPEMISLSKDYQKEVQFIFISIDGAPKNWKKAAKELKLPNPSLIIDSVSRVNYEFDKSVSVPSYLILDSDGMILSISGSVNSIQEKLEQLTRK